VSHPQISAIITCYNSQATIARALESVLSQTLPEIEIVVVDDASTDATSEIVQSFPDRRIRLIRNERNRGIGGAKNVGVAASQGEFIAFLDSDDAWVRHKLATQLGALKRNVFAVPLGFSAFWVHRMHGSKVVLRRPSRHQTWLKSILVGETFSLGSTLLATRKCFDVVGPFNEALRRLQDRDWTLRYLQHWDEFLCLDEPLAHIHNSGWPRPETVVRSLEALYDVHQQDLRARDPALVRLFRASLHFEAAVHEYRSGMRRAAVRRFARAVAAHPPYVGYLAGRLKRKLVEHDFT
jgi:glycosyltransferase involved in cell wall biosynthesis